MTSFKRLLMVFVCASMFAYAQSNAFEQVRYNGGSIDSKVDPKDWGNTLTVSKDAITLQLNDKQKVVIPPKSVTSLSYGQEAHRRVGLSVLVPPMAIFGMLNKTRLHYIGIEYTTAEGENNGILLQGDKDNYRPILVALHGVTSVPVTVGDKERGFVPTGIKTLVTKLPDETKKTQTAKLTQTAGVDLRFRWTLGTVGKTGEVESQVLSDPAALSQKYKTAELYWKEVAGADHADGNLDPEHPAYVAIWEVNETQKLGADPQKKTIAVTGVVYARHESGCLLVPGVFGTFQEGPVAEDTLKKGFKETLQFLGTAGKKTPAKTVGCYAPEALGVVNNPRDPSTDLARSASKP